MYFLIIMLIQPIIEIKYNEMNVLLLRLKFTSTCPCSICMFCKQSTQMHHGSMHNTTTTVN